MSAVEAPVWLPGDGRGPAPKKRFRVGKLVRRAWWQVRRRGRLLTWIGVPALAGALLAANLDLMALPLVGPERLAAVFLLDGQGYIGRVEDVAWSETLTLRDVYYFQDARGTTTNLPLALIKRGGEVHAPADGIRIRRDKVLAVERVGLDSQVAHAIASQRALERKGPQ